MVHGAEATVDEEPRFAERVRALAALRLRTAGHTTMARFRGQAGLELDGDSGFTAYAYESVAGPAVIVAACGAAARGKVTVTPEAFAVQRPPAEGTVYFLDGTQAAHAGAIREFDLGQDDVAVWTL
jgi:hypothetical protein